MRLFNGYTTLDRKKLIRDLSMMVVFNTLVALFIKLIFHSQQSFLMVWVFSMLIGFSINGLIDRKSVV